MIENCARPGCGHDHKMLGRMAHDIGTILCVQCPCPSYRTQAQQEAWESAARSSALTGAGGNVPVGVLRRLLELYP